MQRRYERVLIRAYTVASPEGPCSTFRREARIAAVAHVRIDQSFPRYTAIPSRHRDRVT